MWSHSCTVPQLPQQNYVAQKTDLYTLYFSPYNSVFHSVQSVLRLLVSIWIKRRKYGVIWSKIQIVQVRLLSQFCCVPRYTYAQHNIIRNVDRTIPFHNFDGKFNLALCACSSYSHECVLKQRLINTYDILNVLFCFHYPTRDLQERQSLIQQGVTQSSYHN